MCFCDVRRQPSALLARYDATSIAWLRTSLARLATGTDEDLTMDTSTTVGFTVYCDDLEAARAALSTRGASSAGAATRVDRYVGGPTSWAWFEEVAHEDGGSFVVETDRPMQPGQRAVISRVTRARPGVAPPGRFLTGHEVMVRRETWIASSWQAHIEQIDGAGDFLRFEVPVPATPDTDEALAAAATLADAFGIRASDVLPWSSAELAAMYRSARRYRADLGTRTDPGRLVLLDGASGSGKTTIFRKLTDGPGETVARVPRYSTRAPRGDGERAEYVFVSADHFRKAVEQGEFIESRDFLFGMSYGLPWRAAFDQLRAGRDALGIIDYGNAGHVRRILPEAALVLVEASPDTLRARLAQRGTNTEEQIDERLSNAVALASRRDVYDLVVRNEDGELDRAVADVRRLLTDRRR